MCSDRQVQKFSAVLDCRSTLRVIDQTVKFWSTVCSVGPLIGASNHSEHDQQLSTAAYVGAVAQQANPSLKRGHSYREAVTHNSKAITRSRQLAFRKLHVSVTCARRRSGCSQTDRDLHQHPAVVKAYAKGVPFLVLTRRKSIGAIEVSYAPNEVEMTVPGHIHSIDTLSMSQQKNLLHIRGRCHLLTAIR